VHSEDRSAEPGGESKKADLRYRFRLVAILVLGILLGWFALANIGSVRIDFWLFHRQAPLILVIVISGLLGALIAALIMRRNTKAKAEAEE
jgi:uncharacterized integral membrane protein